MNENGARATAPAPVSVQSSETDDGNWRDEVARGMAEVVLQTRRELRAERDKALSESDRRIARLETQVETLLTLLGADKLPPDKAAAINDDRVVDLPRGFLRRRGRNG
jgi:hypothetical protein